MPKNTNIILKKFKLVFYFNTNLNLNLTLKGFIFPKPLYIQVKILIL